MSPSERDQMIIDCMPLVRGIAFDLQSQLGPKWELQELIQCGMVGLVKAANRFDESRNVSFLHYARFRVRGEMLDRLRPPSVDSETAEAQARIRELACPDKLPDEQAIAGQLYGRVREAMSKCLLPRQIRILREFYETGKTVRKIGEEMGISEARVWQIRAAALKKLRVVLETRRREATSSHDLTHVIHERKSRKR